MNTENIKLLLLNPEFKVRALSALVLMPAMIAVTYLGGIPFMLLLAAAAMLMINEWHRLWESYPERTYLYTNITGILLSLLCVIFHSYAWLFILQFLIAGFYGYRAFMNRDVKWQYFTGYAYIVIPIAMLLIMRQERDFTATIWIFAIVWSTDIGAYFAGRIIGGPKIAPFISPSKTWAGLIGGALLAVIVSLIFKVSAEVATVNSIAVALLAVISQVGDFLESWFKRLAGVKDSGALIPGHGGILDRVDGLLLAIPFYFMFEVL